MRVRGNISTRLPDLFHFHSPSVPFPTLQYVSEQKVRDTSVFERGHVSTDRATIEIKTDLGN